MPINYAYHPTLNIVIRSDGMILLPQRGKPAYWTYGKGDRHKQHRIFFRRKEYRVSHLVAETYIPNPNGFRGIRHKNGYRFDNSVQNLEWVDGRDN